MQGKCEPYPRPLDVPPFASRPGKYIAFSEAPYFGLTRLSPRPCDSFDCMLIKPWQCPSPFASCSPSVRKSPSSARQYEVILIINPIVSGHFLQHFILPVCRRDKNDNVCFLQCFLRRINLIIEKRPFSFRI